MVQIIINKKRDERERNKVRKKNFRGTPSSNDSTISTVKKILTSYKKVTNNYQSGPHKPPKNMGSSLAFGRLVWPTLITVNYLF
jgi:hypothetical protein